LATTIFTFGQSNSFALALDPPIFEIVDVPPQFHRAFNFDPVKGKHLTPETADPMAGDLPDIPPIPPALGVSRAGKRQRIFNPLVPTYIDYPASHREKAGHGLVILLSSIVS
jgi:hypothetical protein